jgi:multidrug resistance efflux pump
MEPEVLGKKFIQQGEKIGTLHSSNLERFIVELEGQLEVEKALLSVYATGEKPQLIAEAETSLNLAREKFEIQKKLLERKKVLFADSLIAPQEYDIALNEFEVTRINYELAKARLQTISTGEKPQQLKYSMEKIVSLENQINTLKSKMKGLEITSPFSGLMVRKKTNNRMLEILANVVDTSTYIIITPVQLKELKYLSVGGQCSMKLLSSDCVMEGKITHIDNGIQIVNGKQAVYVTAMIEKHCSELLPGIIAQTVFMTGELTVYEYIVRFVKGLFYR